MSRDSEEAFGDPTGSIRKVLQDANPQIFPKALAARIGELDIWIADRGGVEPANLAAMDLDPKFVISVNQQATEATTDHHPLKEGYMNDQQEFKQAVETTGNRLQQSGLVIVNCAAGISRSTAVSATAIAANEGYSFDTVVKGGKGPDRVHTPIQNCGSMPWPTS
jgi:atypical dual specificity phosphatase